MKKITLSSKTLIAKGSEREVHFISGSKDLIVKVQRPELDNNKKKLYKIWIQNVSPISKYRQYFIETRDEMKAQLNAQILGINSPLAPIRGVAQTNMGPGLVMEQISSKNGELAETLQIIKDNKALDKSKIKGLNECISSILKLNIVLTDPNPSNFVWCPFEKRFFIVDGFSDRTLIPIRSWFPILQNSRLQAKLSKLAGKLNLHWDEKQRQFSKL